jgi:hypothetical protein
MGAPHVVHTRLDIVCLLYKVLTLKNQQAAMLFDLLIFKAYIDEVVESSVL